MDNFVSQIKNALYSHFGSECKITVRENLKNNGIKKIGITVHTGDGPIAPVIYLDDFYRRYMLGECKFEEIVERIIDAIDSNSVPSDFICIQETLLNWDYAVSRVYPVLVSTERNSELLQSLVSRPLLDLSVIYILRLDGDEANGMASIKITPKLLESYGVTENDLYTVAIRNMGNDEYELKDMREILSGLAGDELTHDFDLLPGPTISVITSRMKMYSAAGILDKDFMKTVTSAETGYFVIPSSIHELILIKDDGDTNPLELETMICEVNATQVDYQDILSDHPYYYSQSSGLQMCVM